MAEPPAAYQLAIFSTFAAMPAMATGHLRHSAWYNIQLWARLLQCRRAENKGNEAVLKSSSLTVHGHSGFLRQVQHLAHLALPGLSRTNERGLFLLA